MRCYQLFTKDILEDKELKDELENMHPVDIVEMLEDGLEYGKIEELEMILHR